MKGTDGNLLRTIPRIAAGDYLTFGMCLLQDENGVDVDLLKKTHSWRYSEMADKCCSTYTRTYQHLIECLRQSELGALAEDLLVQLLQKVISKHNRVRYKWKRCLHTTYVSLATNCTSYMGELVQVSIKISKRNLAVEGCLNAWMHWLTKYSNKKCHCTQCRVPNEKANINETNWTLNQYTEYSDLYIKQQNERRQILSFQGNDLKFWWWAGAIFEEDSSQGIASWCTMRCTQV